MRIGCIGTGTIGSMLIEALSSKLPEPPDFVVCNRSRDKIAALARRVPSLVMVATAAEVAQRSQTLFICVKSPDLDPVIDQIRPFLSPDHVLLITASGFEVERLEHRVPARVGKIIPSITQFAGGGAILTRYGPRMDRESCRSVDGLLSFIGTPLPVTDDQIRVYADLTSCGPAFFAALLQAFARAASATGRIGAGEAEHLLQLTWSATARLFENGFTPEDVRRKVSVPGGVTEAGLAVLDPGAETLFRDLFAATQAHHLSHQPSPGQTRDKWPDRDRPGTSRDPL
ncbi:pyrroline-5-carboxylate reductase dimerization domain-containing protein [Kyrpidia tusciae]|uniref:NADP oxidoreductase coenzyme F420-dependent n=1 Tax=Kyrpidia tusciae (strain DSM 2912 / NBRC 15312 / T2) TaxID=562970 RepID=D5WR94_KYRT2|nr:pyrroline-5-carboxylate reductase dimerization domain-containing protein [Kyrpidia tusciae]ADG06824.1 NADP oxidoreductase coenzyme F420-dependent [Kyrpidia tusciae DSM 2912]